MRIKDRDRRLIEGQVSRKEAVFRVLRGAIIDGRLSAGARLNQDELAAELGVSRMPVREALKKLEAENLVVFYPYRGVAVASLDPDAIEELFAMRIALEQLAIGRAVDRLVDKNFERMRRFLERMDRRVHENTGDADEWMRLNQEFHVVINGACGWPRLIENIDVLRAHVERYVRLYLTLRGREQPQREHWQIYEACRARDADAARVLIAQHLANTANALQRAIADRAEADDSPAGARPAAVRELAG